MDKQCVKCGETKPIEDFYPNGEKRRSRCKACSCEDSRAWKIAHPGRYAGKSREWRENNLERATELDRIHALLKYSITPEQYDKLLSEQGGMCAICECTPEQNINGRRLGVDHDHTCCTSIGASCGSCVRGLLCNRCNNLLGRAKDSVEILAEAIVYLLSWENELAER